MYAVLDGIIDEARRRIRPARGFANDAPRRLYATAAMMTIDDILIGRNFIYPKPTEPVRLLSDGLTERHLPPAALAALLSQDENARRRGRMHDDQPV